MATARDIMTADVTCVGEHDTLAEAARRMRDLGVGALPICGDDDRLKGMLTDRDIVVRCIADGGDPASVEAGSFGQAENVTVGADDDVATLLATMKEHAVRRVPVIDKHDLVGIVSQADVARSIDDDLVGDLVASISD